jgi:hypothetical protein
LARYCGSFSICFGTKSKGSYLIERSCVTLVGSEPQKRNQLLSVPLVVDGAQLHHTAEALDDVSVLVVVFGCNALEELDKAADDDGLDLL